MTAHGRMWRKMAQHFLLTKAARTLSLASVFRMSDGEAEATFRAVRWPDTQGEAVCPHCGSPIAYECRRANGALVGLRTDGARNTITESRHPRAAAFGLIAFSP